MDEKKYIPVFCFHKLGGKAGVLRAQGMGSTKFKENTWWKCGQLSQKAAKSILNTLCWLFNLHFGLGGREEHHSMKT